MRVTLLRLLPDHLPETTILIAIGLLAALLGVPVMALYRRLEKPDLLLAEARRRVYEHVARNPGMTAAEIAAAEGVHRKTVVHHARLLLDHSLLEAERDGRAIRYFLPGDRARRAPAQGVAAALLQLALERPGLTQTEAAQALGVCRATVQWHTRRLVDRGLLEPGRLVVALDQRERVRTGLGATHPWPVA